MHAVSLLEPSETELTLSEKGIILIWKNVVVRPYEGEGLMVELVVFRFEDVYLPKPVTGFCLINDAQINCDLSFGRLFR